MACMERGFDLGGFGSSFLENFTAFALELL
jgi:hypothetical protein